MRVKLLTLCIRSVLYGGDWTLAAGTEMYRRGVLQ